MGLTKPRAAQIYNLDYKQATRVVTTTNITLTGGAPATVDGVTLSANNRVLVTGQTTGSQNGLYLVTTVGSGSTGTWARTSDGNDTGEIEAGMIVMVTEGVIYADTQWKLITDDPITIGTTALTFTQNYMANSISSGTSNVVVNSNANVTISSAGTANILTITSTGIYTSGLSSVTGNITVGNVSTGGLISATGNVQAGNIRTVGLISATGNITIGNVSAVGNITSSNYYFGNGYYLTGVSGGGGSGGLKWTTQANTAPVSPNAGDFWYNSYSSIKYQYTNDGTSNVWVDQSAPTSFTTITVGNVVNAGATGVGNIGSAGGYFNTVFAKATSAQYADLAEMYMADQDYPAGTVVEFGGNYEIIASTQTHSTSIAGVISTNPSYLMNSDQKGDHVLPVALTGRVPCQVVGTMYKGDRLVASSITGVATRLNKNLYEPGCIIGKALEDYNSGNVGIIEIAVGRY
jgi:hypothetical protein